MAGVIDFLQQVTPKVSLSYLAAFDGGDSPFQQHQITTPYRLSHFLAKVLHESDGLTLEHESMNYSAERLLEIFGAGRHSAAIMPNEAQRLAHDERTIAERI
jgi:putative chitinase